MKTKGALAAEVLKRVARKSYTGNQKKFKRSVATPITYVNLS